MKAFFLCTHCKYLEQLEKPIISVRHTDRKFYYQCTSNFAIFHPYGWQLNVIIRYLSVRENSLVSFSFRPQKTQPLFLYIPHKNMLSAAESANVRFSQVVQLLAPPTDPSTDVRTKFLL